MNKVTYSLMMAMLLFASCRSLRPGELSDYPKDPGSFSAVLHQHNSKPYHSFYAKASIAIETEKEKLNFRANIKMVRDSIIWASVSPGLGIEVVRMQISPDSVFILNRLDKTVNAKSFEEVQRLLKANISFHDLQSLIWGEPLQRELNPAFINEDAEWPYLCNYSEKSLKRIAKNREVPIATLWSISMGGGRLIASQELKDFSQQRTLLARYTHYVSDEELGFWIKEMSVTTETSEQGYQHVDISFNKPKINNNFNIKFRVPENYEMVY